MTRAAHLRFAHLERYRNEIETLRVIPQAEQPRAAWLHKWFGDATRNSPGGSSLSWGASTAAVGKYSGRVSPSSGKREGEDMPA